jgi:ADP-ribose pyrophosphatase YjhB (NUDIX family)
VVRKGTAGPDIPKWLAWARQLHSLSQAGLSYSQGEYDLERYRRLQEIAAEILASRSDLSTADVLGSLQMQAGYATPKVDVRGAVFRHGRVLLVKEKADGRWCLPGGWGDLGDRPSETAEREVREESGFRVRAAKVIAVQDANRIDPLEFYHAYKITFLCSLEGGEAQTSHETLAVDFFGPDDLPPLSTFRTSRALLEEAFAHLADPARPTAFD